MMQLFYKLRHGFLCWAVSSAAHTSFLFEGRVLDFRALLHVLESQDMAWYNFMVL